MHCKRCQNLMQPVKAVQPEELIEVESLDFFGCSEVILWCCENCGQTFVNCPKR